MKKKKGMSGLQRTLLCSLCVLLLVLTFFIIKWTISTPEDGDKKDKSVETIADVGKTTPPVSQTGEDLVTTPVPTSTPVPTPTPVPQAKFEKEYPHRGEAEEETAYEEGVVYGLRYPLYEDEAMADAAEMEARRLLAEGFAHVKELGLSETELVIDYEDGEAGELVSVLFHMEIKGEGITETKSIPWTYNKKKIEPVAGDALFMPQAFRYVAEVINKLEQEKRGQEVPEDAEVSEGEAPEEVQTELAEWVDISGTYEALCAYVLTEEGVKFYYGEGDAKSSVVIPYIELHTYMMTTVSGNGYMDGIRELDPEKPMIAMTFDDGPHYIQTPRLLNILEEYGAKATFFVLGDRSFYTESNKNTVKMIYDSGNEVASHTYAHKDLATLSGEALTDEFVKARENLYDLTGEYPIFVRPPYGSCDKEVQEASFAPLINWSVDSKDWSFRDTEKTVEHTRKSLGDGKVVLMHDIYMTTVDAAEILIKELTEQGYQIVTLRELFYYKGVELTNGTVYHSSYN